MGQGRRLFATAWLVVMLSSLTACGFHLRGSLDMPPQMTRTFIQGAEYSDLARELRLSLGASGVTVVEQADEATAVLRILNRRSGRRVLSVARNAKVAEYELVLSVRFAVDRPSGARLVPPQRVQLTRDYRSDPEDVLGKAGEEQILREEMRRDMAQLILRRLAYRSHGLR